jgi:chorismate synthase
MLRFLTAGESHGQALVTIVEGVPAGMALSAVAIDRDLARRQVGFGRGGRMSIERDKVQILAGVRLGYTLGSPIALLVPNRDWANWQESMAVEAEGNDQPVPVTRVRPGHADLAGALKYEHRDIRNILERASARETTMRVAAGAVARTILAAAGVVVRSYTVSIAGHRIEGEPVSEEDWERVEASSLRCHDAQTEPAMKAAISAARTAGNTVGGTFAVVASGLPIGLGSHVHWDRRLDGALAQALMSIHSVKGVEVGAGFSAADMLGSEMHDQFIVPMDSANPWHRITNNAGGTEGGMSNGEAIVLRAACKPIPTLAHPLPSVDLLTGQAVQAHHERSDACVVPAAGVVGEAMVCFVLARALLEKFGGDSLAQLLRGLEEHRRNCAPSSGEA